MLPVKDTAAWKEPAGAGESGDHGGPLPGSASKIASQSHQPLAIDGVLDAAGASPMLLLCAPSSAHP